MKTLLFVCTWVCSSLIATAQIPVLNSYTTAPATIYLDFDGEIVTSGVWNNGNTFTAESPNLSSDKITEIFNRVSEDYKLFKINVTTELAKYTTAPITQRIRVIITPTGFFAPGNAGIAYMNSFSWGDDTPAFVFAGSDAPPKFVAEAASHESGHSLGCAHQSIRDANCNIIDQYNHGTGSGEIGWAPIMGYSVDRTFTTWSNGQNNINCSAQDDIATINAKIQGGGLRPDDIVNTTASAPSVTLSGINVSAIGVINNSTDIDMHKITITQQSKLVLSIAPPVNTINETFGNVDLLVNLLNSAGNVIRSYNNADYLSVTIDTILPTGIYYLAVDGTSNANINTDYGSTGTYFIKGTLQSTQSLPIYRLELKGTTNNNHHILSWLIEADEPITKSYVEYATDGVHFATLQQVDYKANSYNYKPFSSNTIYYRMKAFLKDGSYKTSNIITLQSAKSNETLQVLNNVISDRVLVTTQENTSYQIFDMSGKTVTKGSLVKNTVNQIAIDNVSTGIYILKTFANNQIFTHRLLKQ
jgi:Secretion system C-terminal sorting domain